MRKYVFFVFVVLLAFSFTSCEDGADGLDGEDGEAFLKLEWDWYVDSYGDDNPDLPTTISENYYYQTSPGTYNFTYYCSDGIGNYWHWRGHYIVEINYGEDGEPGEQGELFSEGADGTDGADGEDNYYRLYLEGINGVSFTLSKMNTSGKELKVELKRPNESIDKSEYIKDGDVIVTSYKNSGNTITVNKQLYVKR